MPGPPRIESGARQAERRHPEHAGRHGARIVVELGVRGDVPGQDADQQPRVVAPDVVVRIVLDQLEAAEGERTTIWIAQEQPVEHASAARVRSAHEQRELPVFGLEPATEPPGSRPCPRAARGSAGALRTRRSRRSRSRPLPSSGYRRGGRRPARVVVVHVEGDPPAHALVEAQIGSRSPSRPPRATARIPSATRSAKAAIVKLGFTPTGPGIAAPSAT